MLSIPARMLSISLRVTRSSCQPMQIIHEFDHDWATGTECRIKKFDLSGAVKHTNLYRYLGRDWLKGWIIQMMVAYYCK